MSKPLIVIGGGGHAGVIIDILKDKKREILAYSSIQEASSYSVFNQISHLIDDKDVLNFNPEDVLLINAIGPNPKDNLRQMIFEKFSSSGYQFDQVISPSAYVSSFSSIGQGVQIFPCAAIQTEVVLSEYSVINTGAIIEHNCIVGAHSHIAPGATLCGQVSVGSNVYIGAGAKVRQNISIGNGSVIAMGASVIRDVPPNSLVIPGKAIIEIDPTAKLERQP